VSAGKSYLVGERGPELLTMGANGYVTPNSAMGGGMTIVVNALDPKAAGKAVVDAIQSYESSNGKGWRG
jgi:phage-related minor tail protein